MYTSPPNTQTHTVRVKAASPLLGWYLSHRVACIFFSWQSHAGTAAHAHLLASLRLITLPPMAYLHSHVTAIPKTRTYTHQSPAQFRMGPITVQLCTFLFTNKSACHGLDLAVIFHSCRPPPARVKVLDTIRVVNCVFFGRSLMGSH